MRVHSAVELGKLGSRITAHGAEPAAKSVLDKLSGSQPALSAIADMKLSDAQLGSLVTAFTKAIQIKVDFRLLLAQEEAFLKKAPRLTRAVADLRSFVTDVSAQSPNGIRAALPMSDE